MRALIALTLWLALAGAASSRTATAQDAATAGHAPAVDGAAGVDGANSQKSIDSAGRSLGRWQRFSWYDSARDEPQPVLVQEREPPRFNFSWLNFLAWIAIALVLAGLVWLIVSALQNYMGPGEREALGPRVATRVDHVEALPFLKQRSLDDLLGQAQQHFQAGNFDEAIIYLYSYQLVELDRRSLIRLAAGKTNRQYLRELRGRGTLAGLLEQSMVAFEDVYFGDRRLPRERFEHCWNRLAEFETLIGAAAAAPLAVPIPSASPLADALAEQN